MDFANSDRDIETSTTGLKEYLPLTDFGGFFSAIISNDVGSVLETLGAHTGNNKELLNGIFVSNDGTDFGIDSTKVWSKNKHHLMVSTEINRPWHLAAAFGATDVLKILYDNGVDVNSVNVDGANAINCLIAVGVTNPTLEERMRDTYVFMTKLLTTSELRNLLAHE